MSRECQPCLWPAETNSQQVGSTNTMRTTIRKHQRKQESFLESRNGPDEQSDATNNQECILHSALTKPGPPSTPETHKVFPASMFHVQGGRVDGSLSSYLGRGKLGQVTQAPLSCSPKKTSSGKCLPRGAVQSSHTQTLFGERQNGRDIQP